jgi:TGS domain
MANALAEEVKAKLVLTHSDAAKAKAPYYAKRVSLFEQYKARAQADLEAARAKAEAITITLPDGSTKAGVKNVTTPLDVAAGISKGLAAAVVVALVDDATWDVFRPLEGDCRLKLCTFDDTEGRDVRVGGLRWVSYGGGECLRACVELRCELTHLCRICVCSCSHLLHRRSGTAAPTCWARCWS